jgi:hypothetical protein
MRSAGSEDFEGDNPILGPPRVTLACDSGPRLRSATISTSCGATDWRGLPVARPVGSATARPALVVAVRSDRLSRC